MSRAQAIHWKTDYAPRVTTKNDELVLWPDALGSRPSESVIDGWVQEYLVYSKGPEIILEAERRIEAGVLIGGNLVRCDDQSVSRIHGMLKKAERLESQSKPVSIKFKTSAGVTVTITSALDAGVIYDAISDHIAFVLCRSSGLQDAVVGMTQEQVADFNPRDEIHWTE